MADEFERIVLSDVEIALIDSLKTALEVIIHAHPGSEKYLARAYGYQSDAKLKTDQPDGAAVHELLRQFVANPERQEARERLAKFLSAEPEGRA